MTPELDKALAEMEARAKRAAVVESHGYDICRTDVPRLIAALRVLSASYMEADENDGAKCAAFDRCAAILTGKEPS